jgi:hypothetical protein
VPLVPPKQARPSSQQWLDPDGLEPAAERARVCWTIRSVPVGLCVVRLASRTHTLRHCAGLAPTLADFLKPSSQRTRLPLGFGCHLNTPPKDGCVDTTPGYELIGARMLILAAGDRGLPMDYDELARWTRIGFERGSAMRRGER